MAHTNHTTNYELSQFVGTDKPTFLGDYNGDMQKIDAAIKGAKDTADGASTTAESAAALATTASQTATQAATDAASASANATTALNTANNATTAAQSASTTASAAATTAEGAATTANAAKTEAEAATAAVALKPSYDEMFARMFSMTSEQLTPIAESGYTYDSASSELYGAKNADASLGKFYGRVRFTFAAKPSGVYEKIATIATGYGTRDADFTIAGYSAIVITSANAYMVVKVDLVVKTNGNVEMWAHIPAGITSIMPFLPPCLLVLSDFGD